MQRFLPYRIEFSKSSMHAVDLTQANEEAQQQTDAFQIGHIRFRLLQQRLHVVLGSLGTVVIEHKIPTTELLEPGHGP